MLASRPGLALKAVQDHFFGDIGLGLEIQYLVLVLFLEYLVLVLVLTLVVLGSGDMVLMTSLA